MLESEKNLDQLARMFGTEHAEAVWRDRVQASEGADIDSDHELKVIAYSLNKVIDRATEGPLVEYRRLYPEGPERPEDAVPSAQLLRQDPIAAILLDKLMARWDVVDAMRKGRTGAD